MFDTVFKRLMEDERVVKFFIGTILNVTVVGVTIQPQEFTYEAEPNQNVSQVNPPKDIKLYRLDFIVVIKTDNGELKKVLIEIQKAKNSIDLMRFRNYLGDQYKKQELVKDQKTTLPIVTIYILGFNLKGIDTACLKVERQYRDLVNDIILEKKDEFIDKLTHDSYVVQTEKISDKYNTRLDKLLSIFEQNYYTNENRTYKEFKHEIDMEEIKIMTDILHHSATDNEERRKIEIEREAQRTYDAHFGDIIRELEKNKKALDESKEVIEEKDIALDEKDKALDEKDRLIEELKRRLGEN